MSPMPKRDNGPNDLGPVDRDDLRRFARDIKYAGGVAPHAKEIASLTLRLLDELAREKAERARGVEIGLHGEARPMPCSAEKVMLAIPRWVRDAAGIRWNEGHPEFGRDEDGYEALAIDACIAPAVSALWEAGFVTLGCCCGHTENGHAVVSFLAGHVKL